MKQHFRYATRINSFKARTDLHSWKEGKGSVLGLMDRMDLVKGLSGVFVNYPEHIAGPDGKVLKERIRDSPLEFYGWNIRFPEEFLDGGFTNPSPNIRSRAIDLCKRSVDDCRTWGGSEVVIWPALDGFDYPLQNDFETLWKHELEGIAAVAEYGKDLKISIEFKPADPRRRCIFDSTATTLLAVNELGFQNLGLTLDYCHVLMAKENPALSAVHCLRQEKLFGMHMNDGNGFLDDGLMVGSTTPWPTLELVYYLLKYGFGGVLYFDTFPVREDPVAESESNIAQMESFADLIETWDGPKLDELRASHDALAILKLVGARK